jgi:hypothetical protein
LGSVGVDSRGFWASFLRISWLFLFLLVVIAGALLRLTFASESSSLIVHQIGGSGTVSRTRWQNCFSSLQRDRSSNDGSDFLDYDYLPAFSAQTLLHWSFFNRLSNCQLFVIF